MIASDTRPVRLDRVLAQVTDGELVLLHMDQGTYFALNEVGARVWELCDGNVTLASVVDTIASEFEAPRELIEEDVTSLLEELASDGLITY